jgi:hypothetical protein
VLRRINAKPRLNWAPVRLKRPGAATRCHARLGRNVRAGSAVLAELDTARTETSHTNSGAKPDHTRVHYLDGFVEDCYYPDARLFGRRPL